MWNMTINVIKEVESDRCREEDWLAEREREMRLI